MRAILRTGFGGPDVLVIREIPEPEPKAGHAVIAVKAFGLKAHGRPDKVSMRTPLKTHGGSNSRSAERLNSASLARISPPMGLT